MPNVRTTATLLLAVMAWGTAAFGVEPRRVGIGGRVLGEKEPLAAAGVFAYQLADSTLHRVKTDTQGAFLFQNLPAGLYKIIAHKPGFVPVVVLLTRTTAQVYQSLEIELAPRPLGKGQEDDFWSLRAQLPGDVLRQIEGDQEEQAPEALASAWDGSPRLELPASFAAKMEAVTGVDQLAASEAQVKGGEVGIEGRLGRLQVDLRGRYMQLESDPLSGPAAAGQASSLLLGVERGSNNRLTLSSFSNRLVSRTAEGESPVDFESFQVSYTQGVGENGRSEVSAHYTTESNYHRHADVEPLDIPETSQTLRLEGAYTAALGDHTTLQAGLRYRERRFGLSGRLDPADERPALASIDLWSRGGIRLQPAVLVEYGLYSTLSDGSLSLMPQGGIVLQVGPHWQLGASASHRVYTDAPLVPDFQPTVFSESDLCEQGSESCYELRLAHSGSDTESFSLSALHRTVGDTLRLYFSEDFFDRLDSVYLVRGDELPELRMTMSRQLSTNVLATLQSSLASGGGGIFFAPGGTRYENQVRYLVTSLDTQFTASSTGVFVAFHHLAQELQPVEPRQQAAAMGASSELERLRLMVSQDLSFLIGLAADWAVQLNMELLRGSALSAVDDDTIRHRVLGGIAVRF